MIRWQTVVLYSLVLALLGVARSSSQDRAAVIPDMKILLQNDRVRVQFHDVKVGETTAMHSHPAYVAYVFNT